MTTTRDATFSPWPHRSALAVAVLTLPLIFMGGRVTSTGAGMAVPDWPSTFGENVFTFPWSRWVGPVFTEHSHRVMGATVGIFAILLAVAFAIFEKRRAVKALGGLALVLVCFQGVLGGQRVVLYEHGLAPVHGSVAQLFFAFVAALVVITSRRWHEATTAPSATAPSQRRLALALVGVAYFQVLLGAWYRHTAGARLEPHALNAAILLALAILTVRSLKRAGVPWLRSLGLRIHALLGAQIALGIVSWWVKPLEIAPELKVELVSTHLVFGALTVGACVALALAARRTLVHETAAAPAAPAREPAPLAGSAA